jgi:hypothetical protein
MQSAVIQIGLVPEAGPMTVAGYASCATYAVDVI